MSIEKDIVDKLLYQCMEKYIGRPIQVTNFYFLIIVLL